MLWHRTRKHSNSEELISDCYGVCVFLPVCVLQVVQNGSDGGVATHQFVSQRDIAKMALISPELIHGGTAMRVSAPNMRT